MSTNPQQHKTLLETTNGKKASATGRNKFTLLGGTDLDRVESSGKLIESQVELNNNSIISVAASSHLQTAPVASFWDQARSSQQHLEATKLNLSDFERLSGTILDMDQAVTKSSASNKESPKQETNLNSLTSQTPSYSAVFAAPPATTYSNQPPQQVGAAQHKRLPLKKQLAADQESKPASRASSTNKKSPTMGYENCREPEEEVTEEDENDYEDEQVNERLPFESTKHRSSIKQEPYRAQRVSASKQSTFDNHKSRDSKGLKKAHVKISMQENMKPPSFNTSCHPETLGGRKFDWNQGNHGCACVSPPSHYMKPEMDQSKWRSLPYEKKPSRTKSMHLVLKSIILILLTLILAMLLMGFVAASHYLPQMFDKLLSASRSFNVTISG